LKEELGLKNIIFREPVTKNEMPGILKEVDVALVPLRKLDLFTGAIPSKIFEAQAMEIPLLLGVEGEAKLHFIDRAEAGLFYEPENSEEMAKRMIEMASNPDDLKKMGLNARVYVTENFNRNTIAESFKKVL
jgi:glycosyltransferase involved in cell wall biosynthesis